MKRVGGAAKYYLHKHHQNLKSILHSEPVPEND